MNLRPYQVEAISRIDEAVASGMRKPVLILPTGAGKTVTFVEYALRRGGRTLVLAHKDDLLSQAAQKILSAKPDARIGVVKAEKNQMNAPFVVASIQTLSKQNRLDRMRRDFDTIIVDECHRAASPGYRRVLDAFPDAPVILGVTATPERADGVGLNTVFDGVAYGDKPGDVDLISLIRGGFLAMPVGRRVKLDLDFGDIRTKNKDFDSASVKEFFDAANWHEHVTKAWLEHAKGRLTVGFVGRIDQAEFITDHMNAQGIRACSVHGKKSKEEQKRLVTAFERGAFDVMWTVDLMIEGSDIPPINCILMARPTKSRRVFAQAIGRGLRLSPETGKADCLVLDVVGATETHDLVTLADIVGVDKINDGESFLEAQVRDAAEKEILAQQEAEAEAAKKLEAEHKSYDVDLLNSAAETERVVKRGFEWRIDKAKKEASLYTSKGAYKIHKSGERYYGEWMDYSSAARFWRSIADSPDYNAVRKELEAHAKQSFFESAMEKTASDPATERQRGLLRRFRHRLADSPELTKIEASRLMNELFEKSRRKSKSSELQLQ